MAGRAILALDQGTTNTKALLVGEEGEILAAASRPTGVSYPREGWAEQSALAIWTTSAKVIAEVVAQAAGYEIVALGISNQRESVVAWDSETGQPLGPCVIWQCLRSAPLCAELRRSGHADEVRETSGLELNPAFSAGKLRWLIDNATGARECLIEGRLRAGTVDSWLLWKLTGGKVHATDHSNASRTQLLNLKTGVWSERLCQLFEVPSAILPQVLPSDALFGKTIGEGIGIPAGVPIHACLGDSHAALYGHGIEGPGALKVTLGTGSSLMSPTAEARPSTHGLSSTIAWSANGRLTYAMEGNIAVSGHAAAFVAEMLGLGDADQLTRLAKTVADSGGVTFVPALAGLAPPHHDETARGLICGMNLATRPAHVARATLEAIVLQIVDLVGAMEKDLGHPLTEVHVDGTAARSDFLMQLLADISAKAVVRPTRTELSALGVARLAGGKMGITFPPECGEGARFLPAVTDAQRDIIRTRWSSAVARTATASN